ncbi:MAG: hypothetical protein ACYTGL_21110 [Planctomycetota bacterium]|jgi:hypothetical protein
MSDLTLFVIGFGVFGMCIGGTLVLSIGGSQTVEQTDSRELSNARKDDVSNDVQPLETARET